MWFFLSSKKDCKIYIAHVCCESPPSADLKSIALNKILKWETNCKCLWIKNCYDNFHLIYVRNKLPNLPSWASECFFMIKLDASHNVIEELPVRWERVIPLCLNIFSQRLPKLVTKLSLFIIYLACKGHKYATIILSHTCSSNWFVLGLFQAVLQFSKAKGAELES